MAVKVWTEMLFLVASGAVLFLLTSGVSMSSSLYAFLCIHLLLTDWCLSPSICLSMKMIFQGVLLLPHFLCLPIREAAFVLFSKETHLDWFSSIFMYKLRFLDILSVIWESLLSISPFRSFFQLPSYYSDFISSIFFYRSSPDWLQQNC